MKIWTLMVRLILRNRMANLIIIGVITLLMGWQGLKVKMHYEMPSMLPDSDSTSLVYQEFKKQFGQDGSVMYVGIQDEKLFDLDHFRAWYKLTEEVRDIEGVEEVVSVARMFQLQRNDSLRKFDFLPVVARLPQT